MRLQVLYVCSTVSSVFMARALALEYRARGPFNVHKCRRPGPSRFFFHARLIQ